MKKSKDLNKSKSKSKSKSKDKDKDKKDKGSDKKSTKSDKSKSKKSSRNSSKSKITNKDQGKNEETINPEISRINKELGPNNNNLELSGSQIFYDNKNMDMQVNPTEGGGGQRCEGCFENEGTCFCQNCNKYLCNLCETQIHMIPANSNHVRVSLSEIYKMKKLCYHHQQNLEFFCESCDEAICKQCQVIGPHNTNYHRIISIKEAYSKKYYQLSKMKPSLIMKLSELTFYNNKINILVEKENISKRDLTRDIRSQYSELSEKIKDVEGKRNAVLSFETTRLQADANNIHDINNYITDVQNKNGPDMISYLLQFPQLKNRIEKVLEKPLKEKIDLSSIENYPNDLEERHKILNDYDKLKSLIEARDETIWKLIIEKKEKERDLLEEAKKKSQEEIEEWVKLSDKYQKDLKKYDVVCSFCGKYVDKKTINTDCEANEQFYLNFYFTKQAPPLNLVNTSRHFFGEPVSNLNELLKTAEGLWDKQRNENAMRLKIEEEEKLRMERSPNNEMNTNSVNNDENNINTSNNNINNILTSTSKKPKSFGMVISENILKQTSNEDVIRFLQEDKQRQKEIIKEEMEELSLRKSQKRKSIDKSDNINIMDEFFFKSKFFNIKDIVQNFINIIDEKNIDFYALLNGYDLDEDGFMEQNEFELALNKINPISPEDFDLLLQFYKLKDVQKININDLVNKFTQESLDKIKSSMEFK